jgi:hypothetical protein
MINQARNQVTIQGSRQISEQQDASGQGCEASRSERVRPIAPMMEPTLSRRALLTGSAATALGAALPSAAVSDAAAQFAAPDATYSQDELVDTGHRFFGAISKGLASSVEYVFQRAGRPNGYILGVEASGAFVAGLR